jgi:hypothetical protein
VGKKISRSEYLKAKRVVSAYEKQQNAGKFQFLYWLEGEVGNDEAMNEKWIAAKSIKTACEKFLLMKSSDVVKVDYEVMHKSEYFDISDVKGFRHLI